MPILFPSSTTDFFSPCFPPPLRLSTLLLFCPVFLTAATASNLFRGKEKKKEKKNEGKEKRQENRTVQLRTGRKTSLRRSCGGFSGNTAQSSRARLVRKFIKVTVNGGGRERGEREKEIASRRSPVDTDEKQYAARSCCYPTEQHDFTPNL